MVAVIFALLLPAQQPLRTGARLVVAPVTVTNASGEAVYGLTQRDFRLLDHGVRRDFDVEMLEQRVSLVIVVQTNQAAVAALAKLKQVSSLFAPAVAGARGSVAVVTFGDGVKVTQEFTTTPDLKRLAAAGSGMQLLDGVAEALRLLEARPKAHRRVIVLVSEPRDSGSQATLVDVLKRAQAASVTIFPVSFSTTATQFTSRDVPVAGRDAQTGGTVRAMLAELGRLGKDDTAAALARDTGGLRSKFTKTTTLESAIAAIGHELHTQYLLAFQPAGSQDEEYRTIAVELPNHPDLKLRTRPGYWITPDTP